ncbi:MAG TPA: DUF1501 domain-containing protein [Planctomycetaceae bacterium]|nr:DUF1501 domain-containing protein [Planctomycetaceae bacterium]
MITLPGGRVRCCEGVSRREWLRAGGLATLGLSLPQLIRQRAQSAELPDRPRLPSFGRAKSCIVLFLFGAPAHQDLWDLKPHAPAEIRGEFRPIPSSVPDLFLGEHIPRLAQRADQFALVRSVTHPDNTHTVAMHYMLAGVRHARPATNPRNAPDDFPCFGAVMNYVAARGEGPDRSAGDSRRTIGLPPAVSLNAPANQVSANNHIFPGFFAGFLGTTYDPLFVPQNADAADFRPLPAVENDDRLAGRRSLLEAVEHQTSALERTAAVRGLDGEYAKAFDVLTAAEVRRAFDLSKESAVARAAYGKTPFGQGCLLARRLIERGVGLVTVNWERDDAYWDTHKNNFIDMRTKLCPNLDQGFSALLDDLAQRGLLEETLVVALGEFGRTPQINSAAGRDHWAACNTVVMAGAGIPGGAVYGASDRLAAYPASDPVTPHDLAATIYHLLGIDRHLVLRDSQSRPYALSAGEPVWALL